MLFLRPKEHRCQCLLDHKKPTRATFRTKRMPWKASFLAPGDGHGLVKSKSTRQRTGSASPGDSIQPRAPKSFIILPKSCHCKCPLNERLAKVRCDLKPQRGLRPMQTEVCFKEDYSRHLMWIQNPLDRIILTQMLSQLFAYTLCPGYQTLKCKVFKTLQGHFIRHFILFLIQTLLMKEKINLDIHRKCKVVEV